MTQEQTNEENRSVFAEAETVREQRLNSIFTARKKVREIRFEIEDRRFGQGFFQEGQAFGVYRGVIETYLQELEPIFLANSGGRELWNDRDFGEVIVSPAMNEDGEVKVEERDVGPDLYKDREKVRGNVTPVKFDLQGLSCLFEYPNPLQHTFEFEYTSPARRKTRKTVTGQRYIGQKTLDSMYRAANRYLRETGIGLELEEDKGPAEI
jgi:hypothetical protein